MHPIKIYSQVRKINQHKLNNAFLRANSVKQIKKELDQEGTKTVNIYETFSEQNITPLLLAIHNNNEKLVNMLLDIYERDLEVLICRN